MSITIGRRLGWAYGVSSALAAVAAVAAGATFFVPGVLRGTAVMNGSARGTALVVLVLAVPLLVVSMGLAARGSSRATITWLGAATYLLYNAVLFLIATPFNSLFLFYVAMFALSLWALVLTLSEIDVATFARRFSPRLPARAIGAFLGAIAVLNALAWLAGALPAMFQTSAPAFLEGTGLVTMPTYVQDLSFWLPATFVVAVWTWRRRPWGIVLAGALIVYGGLEGVGVAVDQTFGHWADPASTVVAPSLVPAFVVLSLVELAVFYFYIRTLKSE